MSARFLPLLLAVVSALSIVGPWFGQLQVGPQRSLKLVFHIRPDSITIDSPQQNAFGIQAVTNHISADSVNFSVASLAMNYAGKLVNDTLKGIFRQGPAVIPLSMTPGEEKLNRPQTTRRHPPREAPAATIPNY